MTIIQRNKHMKLYNYYYLIGILETLKLYINYLYLLGILDIM